MAGFGTRLAGCLALLCLVTLSGCGEAGSGREVQAGPDSSLIDPPPAHAPPPLPAPVAETRDELLVIARSGSLRRLARRAAAEPAFLSNLGGDPHYNHWYLLRAIGVDPLRNLRTLLDLPHGKKDVGGEVWYIWPDLAARDAEALRPERMDFRGRARLEALLGESGLAKLANGGTYPGLRTAISEDGSWRYFLHETGETED